MSDELPHRECRVEMAGPLKYLMSGEMIHGAQYLDGERRQVPVPYYPSPGPVDDLFAVAERGAGRVGVVGLGTGGLAAHGRDGWTMTFFEYDPKVVEYAREEFSYLSESPAAVEVVVEEGRRALRDDDGEAFDVLVLDAFVGDAVPSHLLTREAVELYERRLADDGVVAFHASNKIVDLPAVIGNAALASGLRVWRRSFDPRGDDRFEDLFVRETRWVAAARDGSGAAEWFEQLEPWRATTRSDEHPVWRDDDAARVAAFR